jgi:hypothetical protein
MIMSTIKSFDDALDFHPGSGQLPIVTRLGRTIATYWGALRDGLAAARTYTELTRRGVSHDAAAQHVFGRHFTR